MAQKSDRPPLKSILRRYFIICIVLIGAGTAILNSLVSVPGYAFIGSRSLSMGKHNQNTLYKKIVDAGLLSNLVFVLDPGSNQSYDGNTMLYDLTGNGNHFQMTSPATFYGTRDGCSSNEYLLFNGVQYLQFAGTSYSWVNPFHKLNGAFTIMLVMRHNSFGVRTEFFSSRNSTSTAGVLYWHPAGESMTAAGFTGTSGGIGAEPDSGSYYENTDTIIISSHVMSSSSPSPASHRVRISSGYYTYTTVTTHYPSTSDTDLAPTLLARSGGLYAVPANFRLYGVAIWSRELSSTESSNLRTALISRFSFE